MRPPTFTQERTLHDRGHFVIGVDEVGCGCLAGPVVAAAMHLPITSRLSGIRDSKLLSALQRERLFTVFLERGYRWGIGEASPQEIDRHNIRQATYLAMRRAIDALLVTVPLPEGRTAERTPFALIDAWTVPGLAMAQRGIVHGDRLVKSIAAASIVAKVIRDRQMIAFDGDFPQYGFARHKGYGTDAHRRAIGSHGLSPIHRKTFCRSHGRIFR